MALPSVDIVNDKRLERFAGQISETLASQELGVFRNLVEKFEAEHDVSAVEVAAALAHMAQGGRPLLMEELPTPPAKQARMSKGAKDGFGSRGPTRTLTEGNATYRIAVGRRQRVMPGSIVGALANEGGFNSGQIGGIDIRADHTLVELPAELSKDQWNSLSRTRIGGELIRLELDTGRAPRREREGGGGGYRKDRGGFDGNRGGGGGYRKDEGSRGGSGGSRKPRSSQRSFEGGRGRSY